MKPGFYRVVAAAPKVTVADVAANTKEILGLIKDAYKRGADLITFPELCITAYTCGDLFHSAQLLTDARKGIDDIARASIETPGMLIIIGAPVECRNVLFNCAVFIADGKVLTYVPKTYLPNSKEFYEKRWFSSGEHFDTELNGTPFNASAIVNHCGVMVGAEICEDVWGPVPPSSRLSVAGAEVIVNLSASDDLVGKYNYIKSLLAVQSSSCMNGYVYASAGFGESTTDLVFDAKLFVYECGELIAENKRWQRHSQLVVTDLNIDVIRQNRISNTTYSETAILERRFFNIINLDTKRECDTPLLRKVDPEPFLPADRSQLSERCREVIEIQVAGLAKRLEATRCNKLVVGISGGLDSTLALLIAVRTLDSMGIDRKGVYGVTMPGFGTTGRTYNNALSLMNALGVTVKEISIVPAVTRHFQDIAHDPTKHDVTYENSQARERTQILMDLANEVNGMVLGTGDLSELALGWATYNGDQMSMYGINAGVPKTLVKYVTRHFALENPGTEESKILLDIIDTPISPELLPSSADGKIEQKTEDLVGPYELHDFFLYYTLRYGLRPRTIFNLAASAFDGKFDKETVLKWERIFFRRFFAQQFKRSCMPDGPKVFNVSLSPRGDWRMPSDASSAAWLADLDSISL